MAGGGMHETGAGGSAPNDAAIGGENHCAGFAWVNSHRWPIIAGRPRHQDRQRQGQTPVETLDAATGKLLDNNKNPSPKTGQLDNRGRFYLGKTGHKSCGQKF